MYIYAHGGNAAFENGKSDILDLSANINPLGMPEGVAEAIARAVTDCERYPDSLSTDLRERIARFENVRPEWIFCGNGASDIIFRLPKAVRAKNVLITAPAFSDYERSARASEANVRRYALDAGADFVPDGGFIEAVRAESPDLVFLCNPNNPTGKTADARYMRDLLDTCAAAGAWAAIDECFMDFVENSGGLTCKILLESNEKLIIIKAFTKTFALPGVRLGYAICANADLIGALYAYGADWPVSALAQAAGIAALDGAAAYIKKTVDYVSAERAVIEKGLDALGYKVFGSKANYVFVRNPYAFDLCGELDKCGIRIRSCANYHGLDGSYGRIAVSTKKNNERLLLSLSEITKSLN